MKKQSLVYYIALSIFTLFAIGIPFSSAYIPDEWCVSYSYNIHDPGYLVSGDIENTWYNDNQWIQFRSNAIKGAVDFEFPNVHAKTLKFKVDDCGGLWPEIDIWVYYTTGTPLHLNNVPKNIEKTYSLDPIRKVDYVQLDFAAGFGAISGDYKVDYLTILATF